jgi:hypothetical protein
MNEHILSILTLDKAEAFGSVEPLHNTRFFHVLSFSF